MHALNDSLPVRGTNTDSSPTSSARQFAQHLSYFVIHTYMTQRGCWLVDSPFATQLQEPHAHIATQQLEALYRGKILAYMVDQT